MDEKEDPDNEPCPECGSREGFYWDEDGVHMECYACGRRFGGVIGEEGEVDDE